MKKKLTDDGIEIKEVYTNFDLGLPPDELPGKFPFTRGIQADMYRGKLWTMRQYAGFGTAAESNERYHQLLAAGTTGLSVAFDLPTQMASAPGLCHLLTLCSFFTQ
jgi:methylmalonyl-CoA mutase N-terminal domain/subunit